MPSVQIRPALTTDIPDIKRCAQKAYAKYIERMGKEPAPMHVDFAAQIANEYIHLAIYEDKFAGYVVFYPEDDHMHLESVAVLPEYSGRGIGKRLIDHVERAARQTGYKAIELYTNEAMTENLSMYPRLGYVEVDHRYDAGFNRIFFRKQI